MKYNKNINRIILTITLIIITSLTALAQGPGFDDDVDDTPIDGGSTIVLVAAAGYGYKKIRDAQRNKNME